LLAAWSIAKAELELEAIADVGNFGGEPRLELMLSSGPTVGAEQAQIKPKVLFRV
jgi:hypothetical protein